MRSVALVAASVLASGVTAGLQFTNPEPPVNDPDGSKRINDPVEAGAVVYPQNGTMLLQWLGADLGCDGDDKGVYVKIMYGDDWTAFNTTATIRIDGKSPVGFSPDNPAGNADGKGTIPWDLRSIKNIVNADHPPAWWGVTLHCARGDGGVGYGPHFCFADAEPASIQDVPTSLDPSSTTFDNNVLSTMGVGVGVGLRGPSPPSPFSVASLATSPVPSATAVNSTLPSSPSPAASVVASPVPSTYYWQETHTIPVGDGYLAYRSVDADTTVWEGGHKVTWTSASTTQTQSILCSPLVCILTQRATVTNFQSSFSSSTFAWSTIPASVATAV